MSRHNWHTTHQHASSIQATKLSLGHLKKCIKIEQNRKDKKQKQIPFNSPLIKIEQDPIWFYIILLLRSNLQSKNSPSLKNRWTHFNNDNDIFILQNWYTQIQLKPNKKHISRHQNVILQWDTDAVMKCKCCNQSVIFLHTLNKCKILRDFPPETSHSCMPS